MYLNQIPDLCDISGFTYEWDFDQEIYEEWLKENEYTHNEDVFMEYIIDNVMFTLFYNDHDTSQYMGQIDLDYEDIVKAYGENIAEEMVDVLGIEGKDEGEIEKYDLFNEEIDVNNPYELNKAAMTILPHGEYGKGNRGFILTNGVFVFTEGEHNECSQIPGIRGTFHFLELGNIRVLPESIDIPSEPTREQEQTLAEIIRCYENEYLYITLFDKRGEHDVRFIYPQYNRVLNEIDRFFREGIIPTGESFHESKSHILKGGLFGRINLNEGIESKNMSLAKHYLYTHLKCNEEEAMKYIGAIKSQIPNCRLAKCKFILAMVRMWLDHQLDEAESVAGINKSLKYAASDAHINEYDNNLNGLSAQEVINKFASFAQEDLEQDKQDVSSIEYQDQSNYEIVRIDSFGESEEYGDYVDWCVTHDEEMYNNYTSNGTGVFYFCLRNGWEDEEDVRGEGCPLDSYGLSMIAVSINRDGSCNTITCRWNHDNGGNDTIMSPKELSSVINRNFYEVFKPLTEEEIEERQAEIIDEIQCDINYNILDLKDICDVLVWERYNEETDDYEVILNDDLNGDEEYFDELKPMYMVYEYNTDTKVLVYGSSIVGKTTFDDIDVFKSDNGFLFYISNGLNSHNVINEKGDFLSDTWFKRILWNYKGKGEDITFQVMNNNNKWNLMNCYGKILLNNWVDCFDGSVFGGDNNEGRYVLYINNGKEYLLDVETMKHVFDKPISSVNKRTYRQFDCVWFKFEGDDYYIPYDTEIMSQIAPWKSIKFDNFVSWYYGEEFEYFYGFLAKLEDGKYYALDYKLNLWQGAPDDSEIGFTTKNGMHIVKYNPNTNTPLKNNPYSKNTHESKRPRSIREILTEATDGHFSTQELMALPNFSQKMRYCEQHLGKHVGKGSSRIVYQIDDEKVLKLAFNRKGLVQNSEEASWFKQNYDVFPKIYEYDDNNYQWIICEYVLPAKEKDFEYCLGIPYNPDFRAFVFTAQSQYGNSKGQMYEWSDFDELCEESHTLNELNRYMSDYALEIVGDILTIKNWGLAQRNGDACLVLLDHGTNDDIFEKYYD